MSKHIKVNNKLLKVNKRFSDLKMRQRDWIANLLREKTLDCLTTKKTLTKIDKERILHEVIIEIKNKEIWIPDYEVKQYYNGKIRRYYNIYRKKTC